MTPRDLNVAVQRKVDCTVVCVLFYSVAPCVLRFCSLNGGDSRCSFDKTLRNFKFDVAALTTAKGYRLDVSIFDVNVTLQAM